jgi:two-component system chemotaxis response regulator CheB
VVFKIVVIGTSLGGLSALQVLLSGLEPKLGVAIAIVQHRHKDSDHMLKEILQRQLTASIREVEDKDELKAGQIYLAPPDYHLLIEPDYFSLSTDEPVCFARPSIDVLFESAVDTYGAQTIGVILTGANQDGAQGLARIKQAGGFTIVQDPVTAENSTMPQAAIDATPVDAILPLEAIAPYLNTICSPVRR